MIPFLRASLIILLCCIFNSCGQSSPNPEEARIKLAQMNIKYNENSFFEKVKEGDVVAVKLFLRAGMDPNLKNKYGLSPLIVAARDGRLKVLKFLVDNGANLNTKLENGNDALDLAADRGHKNIEQFLIKKGVPPTYNNFLKEINLFMEMEKKGMKPAADVQKEMERKYAHYGKQYQSYSQVIFQGNVAAVNSLIAQGAMINLNENYGKGNGTILMIAIAVAPENKILPIIEILIKNGAHVNVKNEYGWSPLMLAIQRHRTGNQMRIKWGQLNSPPLSTPSLKDKYILPSEAQDPVISFLVSVGAKID
jgi:ankyrin repeat protein